MEVARNKSLRDKKNDIQNKSYKDHLPLTNLYAAMALIALLRPGLQMSEQLAVIGKRILTIRRRLVRNESLGARRRPTLTGFLFVSPMFHVSRSLKALFYVAFVRRIVVMLDCSHCRRKSAYACGNVLRTFKKSTVTAPYSRI
jgi:hypothetical protein